ncbi:MAG: helix-turn-helix domain-containing protein [Longimicrobiales bacterium]
MSGPLVNGTFFGRVAAPRSIGGVTLAETSYGAGFVVPVHTHDNPMFCLALAGSFTEEVERTSRRFGPRGVFFQPAGLAHAESFHSPASRLFNIQLGDQWLERLGAYDVRLPAGPAAVPSGRLSLLAAQLHAEYRMGATAERLSVDGLLLSMLAELTRAVTRRERTRPLFLDIVQQAIHESLPASPGLTELAGMVQIHPAHLAATFRAHMGCTIGEYTRRARIERARAALTGTDLPIARIAAACGFADQSHLTRVFRAYVGTTPAAYRRNAG